MSSLSEALAKVCVCAQVPRQQMEGQCSMPSSAARSQPALSSPPPPPPPVCLTRAASPNTQVDELLEALKAGTLLASGPRSQAAATAAAPAAPAAPAAGAPKQGKKAAKKGGGAAAPAAAEGDAFSKAHLAVRVCLAVGSTSCRRFAAAQAVAPVRATCPSAQPTCLQLTPPAPHPPLPCPGRPRDLGVGPPQRL